MENPLEQDDAGSLVAGTAVHADQSLERQVGDEDPGHAEGTRSRAASSASETGSELSSTISRASKASRGRRCTPSAVLATWASTGRFDPAASERPPMMV